MIEREIMLSSIEDVKNFVNITMSHDYDIELVSGKYTINAKSIMGIFSVDLTKPLKMVANTEQGDSIEQEVLPYIYDPEKK